MKYQVKAFFSVLLLATGSASVYAVDYSEVSNEDLVGMRTQARDFLVDDREVYRSEMQGRMQSMSTEERSLYQSMNTNRGQGEGSMSRERKGSGEGSGNQYRYGQSESHGEGSMNRYGSGQSSSRSYGSGYGSRQGSGGGHRGGR